MSRILIIICLVLGVNAAFLQSPIATNSIDPCQVTNEAFTGGERLTYVIYFNWNFVWIPAGEVTFQVKERETDYYCTAVGSTYKSYEWFVKVKDRLETSIDKTTLLPNFSIREIQEGNYRHYEKIEFNQKERTSKIWTGKSSTDATVQTKNLTECVQDVLSVFYYTRNFNTTDVKKGTQYPMRIFVDAEEYPLALTYQGKYVNYKVRNQGTFNVLKFQPQVVEGGIFDTDTKMNVWVSDDKNKIPVQLETPLKVGNIKVVLKKYEGLKFPLDSKQKK